MYIYSARTRDITEPVSAVVLACSFVFVKNVITANINGININIDKTGNIRLPP
jgi:hypothetical protein